MNNTILFDARWAGTGGIGKVTTQMARGLGRRPPEGRWVVWSRDAGLAWPGAGLVEARRAPTAWAGQRAALEVPRCGHAIFPANLRPLRPVGRSSMVVLYDTIPLRYAKNRHRAWIAGRLLRQAAHLSTRVLTISQFSAASIVRDLEVDPRNVSVLPIPLDRTLSDAVSARRPAAMHEIPRIFFIGRFAPHKNLERLLVAFARSGTARQGGELVLAGGVGPEVDRMRRLSAELPGARITVLGQLTHDELVGLYASAWALAFPSLEEGFGLPVIEATAAGVPVIATTGGAIPEVVGDNIPLVDPRDVTALARAIDDAVSLSGVVPARLRAWTEGLPTEADLADALLGELGRIM